MTVTTTRHFIQHAVAQDIDDGCFEGRICTRFPPEPNGHLHIGHAKALCVDFGIAEEFGGQCNVRFDDTNPAKEETEYVDGILSDIRWLGFDWEATASTTRRSTSQSSTRGRCELIEAGKAFVCDLSPEEVREHRGTLTSPGQRESRPESLRGRESRDLFARMRAGEFDEGTAHARCGPRSTWRPGT